jgi:hypothetical protein
LLQATGYCEDLKTAYTAGSILVEVLPEAEEMPKNQLGQFIQGEEQKVWLNYEYTINLTKLQLEVCVKCVEHFITQKQLAVTTYTFELMNKLGMKPKVES